MVAKSVLPRKRRTSEHVLADLSVNHVERFILEEGHTALRGQSDYGYDLFMITHDEQGYAEPDFVRLQLKASANLKAGRGGFVFDLDVRDYNLWMSEQMPVILILFDATRRKAFWLFLQQYFEQDASRCPKKGAKTIRVHVPKTQTFQRRAVARLRNWKQAVHQQLRVLVSHA